MNFISISMCKEKKVNIEWKCDVSEREEKGRTLTKKLKKNHKGGGGGGGLLLNTHIKKSPITEIKNKTKTYK